MVAYINPMAGFSKLWSMIVNSTIWREDMHVKIVWITMLAMADRDGYVTSSLPGLADVARVPLDQTIDALTKLSSPDPYSRTKDYEGRRIEEVEGGWRILNYIKYRNMKSREERRIQVREAVRRHREKKAAEITVNTVITTKPIAEADAESRSRDTETETNTGRSRAPLVYSWEFELWWKSLPKKVGKGAAWDAFQKIRPPKPDLVTLLAAVFIQRESDTWKRGYVPNPETWLHQRRWEDSEISDGLRSHTEKLIEQERAGRDR